MKRSYQAIITLLFVIFLLSQVSISASATQDIPTATKDFYVNDFSGIFTNDEKIDLINRAVSLSDSTDGIQVVVTTVQTLDGTTIEDYANKMYNQYGIGKNDMGVLILFSTEDRKIRVEVGKGLESYITDSKAGNLLDKYAIPDLKENKFKTGLISLQTAIIDEINNSVKQETESKIDSPASEAQDTIHINLVYVIFAILSLMILGIIIYTYYEKSEMIKNLEEKNKKLATENSTLLLENRLINRLKQQLEQNEKEYFSLKLNFEKLFNRYVKAQSIFPNIDKLIDEIIENEIKEKDMKKADVVNCEIKKALEISASKDVVSQFNSVLNLYNSLTDCQKSYITEDIDQVNKLYSESSKLKSKDLAISATKKINTIISTIQVGKERDIYNLNNAQSIYNNLDYEAKQLVDNSIVMQISNLLYQAQQDKQNNDDDERRRQENQRIYDSSSNDGFGGGSDGNGASRDF